MTDIEQNRAVLRHWYDHMWGKVNFDLIPDIAAAKYLRHDITGANNLMPAESYRDMLKPVLGHLEVKDFSYYLVCEADYVGAIGRYILEGDKQWDWVQLFRVADQHLVETWLTGMGGTDPMGYPHPRNVWSGSEIPRGSLPMTANKQAVLDWLQSLVTSPAGGESGVLADRLRVHDQLSADREVSGQQYQQEFCGLMNANSVSDFQYFLVGEGDVVFATCSWKLDNSRQWDWVQAFQLENARITRTWLPVIGGNDVSLNVGPGTRWAASAMPATSVVVPTTTES